MTKIEYTCQDCNMVVVFFEGYTMEHLGRAHHGFDLWETK